jgi:hypothetical protein
MVELVNWWISELDEYCGTVPVSHCHGKLVTKAGDSSRVQRMKNVCHWKPPSSND